MIFLKKIIDKFGRLRPWKNRLPSIKSAGAILIEFAFGIPILVMILYFGLDVPQAYRISTKLHKLSELYSQMLINMSKQRESKAVTIADLKNISRSVGLSLTGTLKNKRYPFNLSTYIICIKGDGKNSFKNKWCVHIKNNLTTGEITNSADYRYSTLEEAHSQHIGNIKALSIAKDEIKLLVETVAWYDASSPRGFNSEFYLLTIPGKIKNGAKTFGDRTAIVTPHEGMVSETKPS
ncbi:MAG: hypothetical protein LBO02_03520 [Holosporaceae bacterium]|jgi:hypothetical protein|nr:hypothetical protein [Holosporaceae bacterium]